MKSSNDYIQKIKDLTTELEEAMDENDKERICEVVEQYTILLSDIEDSVEESDDEEIY